MAVLDSKDVHKSLLKKGFVESNSHHKMYEYYYDGKFILHTHACGSTPTLHPMIQRVIFISKFGLAVSFDSSVTYLTFFSLCTTYIYFRFCRRDQ